MPVHGAVSQRVDDPRLAEYRLARGFLETCLLYTSDAADERSSVDLGGRRIIKKKKNTNEDRTEGDTRI